jgi:alpha/beta superfamily hydrolase
MPEPITLPVGDGVVLEGEIDGPDAAPRAAMVLCHPHPQFGGTMRSIVISELFRALPDRGVTCLRFNFRGVEGSTGTHEAGLGERADAAAAVSTLAAAVPDGTPLVLAGWSFGGDVALSVTDVRLSAWLAIAPPLHFAETEPLERDPRPKLIVLAEHDEFRSPDDVAAILAAWEATTVEIVTGASHFFVGRTDAVITAADGLIGRVAR